MNSFVLLLFCLLFQVTQSHPTPLPLAIPVTSTNLDGGGTTSIPTLTSNSTPTNTDYDEQMKMQTTYNALRNHIYSYRYYYSSANPDLFESYKSLQNYEHFISEAFPDDWVEYSMYKCVLSFLSVMPSSLSTQFEAQLTDYQDWRYAESINTTPITTTPTMSSWDTSISVPTSGVYSKFYMFAKCLAMVEDGLEYGHWYDEYIMSKFDDSDLVGILDHYYDIKSDITEEVEELPNLTANYWYDCESFVKVLDGMPWKERVLNSAKSMFVSYSSVFTAPITLTNYDTTLKPNNYSKKGLSGGAIAGIVVGCFVFVAIVVAVIVVICMRKRSKLREGSN
ncbi:unnamed protein product [Ambrosiozyma monospora]|uniref:Unnamed protein product n=1 Tax=Ambrosiozyma monospora TaxID=43982 RepID=A0A9W6YX93_AMBMO|nr:unnamed protein product [Ambrosiozyma monospora]